MGSLSTNDTEKMENLPDSPSATDNKEVELAPLDSENPNNSTLHSLSFKHLLQSCKDKGNPVGGIIESESEDSPSIGRSQSRTVNVGVGNKPPLGLVISPKFAKPLNSILTPSTTLARFQESREEVSRLTPSPRQPRMSRSITLPYIGEVQWETVKKMALEWLRNPKNLAILVWGIAVGVSGAILFMVMVGMLNAVLPKKSDRDLWFEVSNQTINGLFTLLVLYLHPTRILHLIWLIRWRPDDILKLRAVYCKKAMRKPHEWSHILVVVLLLHLNCFSQYALCGLNWGFKRENRPAIGVGICLAFAIGAGCAAGIYNSLSPLGRDFVPEDDEEENAEVASDKAEQGELKGPPTLFHLPRKYRLLERRTTFASREGKVVDDPEWQGGLFDCCESPKISMVTVGCFCCVLGYNLDRLGFGNRYVHIITFLLMCFAPFLVFDIAAINVNDKLVRESLGRGGIVLCVFGLLYGGFWRIRMRQRYNLPSNTWCCGQPNMTDCTQWLFCSCCSLCQEVRTAEAFDVIDDKFYARSQARAESPGHESAHQSVLLNPVPASSIQPPTPVKIKDAGHSSEQLTVLTPPPAQSVSLEQWHGVQRSSASPL